MIDTGRSSHHIRVGSTPSVCGPKIDHSTPRDRAIPVVWNRNSGSANRVNTVVALAKAPPLPSPCMTAGRSSSATPAWKIISAMMQTVGGAMLESSPGTPTIEPGYGPEPTRPISANSPAKVITRACCRYRGVW